MTKVKQKNFVVRLYDGFDNQWIDVTKLMTKENAEKEWNKLTENGTKKKAYGDIDYYKIWYVP